MLSVHKKAVSQCDHNPLVFLPISNDPFSMDRWQVLRRASDFPRDLEERMVVSGNTLQNHCRNIPHFDSRVLASWTERVTKSSRKSDSILINCKFIQLDTAYCSIYLPTPMLFRAVGSLFPKLVAWIAGKAIVESGIFGGPTGCCHHRTFITRTAGQWPSSVAQVDFSGGTC